MRLASCLALLSMGCSQHDYSVQVEQPAVGHGIKNFPETIAASFDISIDVGFQRTNFGQDVSRCQLQVALYYYYQSDGFGDPSHGGDPGDGQEHGEGSGPDESGRIGHPTEAGDCAFTSFTDHHQEGLQPEGGAWQVRGSIDAGEELQLIGRRQDLVLRRVQDHEERVFYELEGCDESSFPFTEVFDLSAPDANMGSDYETLYLKNAIAIGQQIEMTAPGAELIEHGKVYHSNLDDLDLQWIHHGAPLEEPGLGVHTEEMVFVRNMRIDEHRPFEALACLPTTSNSMWLTSEELLQFTPNASRDDNDTYTAIQVDSQTTLQETETPWGQLVRARALITDGGILHLIGE